jgi:hypothetical protein
MKYIQSTIRQFQHESDSWKRMLEKLVCQNDYLKNQLTERLDEGNTGRAFLEVAEEYLNRFIAQDEIMNLIRHDISVYDQLLLKRKYSDEDLEELIEQKNEKMRMELRILDKTFHDLKIQFNNFLHKV